MNILILLAKTAIAFVWLILLLNLFMPFPGKAAIALYIMAVFLFMMHAVQMMIFIGAFGDKINISGWEKWSILIFGIFSLLDIRRKHMQ
jgi:putative membrane protein